MRTVALIVAGGSGRRMGTDLPKQYHALAGVSVLQRALWPFLEHPAIEAVQVVIGADAHARYADCVTDHAKLRPPVTGGAERQDSVSNGLAALTDIAPDAVLIHDGARPLVSTALIDRVVGALAGGLRAVVPALPVTDALKAGDGRRVGRAVDRAGLYRVQTPQGFAFQAIMAAHRRHAGGALADDAAVAEADGIEVAMVAGEEDNLKITHGDDLARAARALLGMSDTRVGNGFDVHRFGPGDHVMLCGVRVPHGQGLIGHSDADVALHALTDAILGALADGDIGRHFPPTDPRWRGQESGLFLAHAAGLVRARGGRIGHVDVTIVCERPKVGPHREAMRARLAGLLAIPVDRISVKATTTEGLGFTGRAEGIAAQATATLSLPG
jgi:2-C-methyl-D-erythritol 4-phosphate cytidylyltransferase/2-C-methyl-D-erythritol 2,4-cyclodiphosphate synthase